MKWATTSALSGINTQGLASILVALQVAVPMAAVIGQSTGLLVAMTAGVMISVISAVTFFIGEQHTRQSCHPSQKTQGPVSLTAPWIADGLLLAGLVIGGWLMFDAAMASPDQTSSIWTGVMVILAGLNASLNLSHRKHQRRHLALLIGFFCFVSGAITADSGAYVWVMALYCLLLAGCLMLPNLHYPALAFTGLLLTAGLTLWMPKPAPSLNITALQPAHSPAPELYADEEWQEEARSGSFQPSFIINRQALEPMGLEQWQEVSRDRGEHRIFLDTVFSYAGFERQFSLPDAGKSRTDDRVIARLQAERNVYLKVRSFDRFDGMRWSQSHRVFDKSLTKSGETGFNNVAPDQSQAIRYRLAFNTTLPPAVPLPGIPESVTVPSPVIAQDQFGQLLLPAPLLASTVIKGSSILAWENGRLVGSADPAAPTGAVAEAELELPNQFDRRIRLKALQLTRGMAKPFQQAQALEAHIRQFPIRQTPSTNTRSVAQYLLEDQSGTPEQAATALAMMMRSIGIPARLVTGLSARQYNPFTGEYEIRNQDVHAWVEARIGDQWLVYEPSAGYELPQHESSSIMLGKQIQEYVQNDHFGYTLFNLIRIISWLMVAALPVLMIALVLRALHSRKGLKTRQHQALQGWINSLKARWLMFQWQRHVAPVVKPNPKQKPSAIPGFEHTLTLGLSTLNQLAALSGHGRKTGELIEDWLGRLGTEKNSDYQTLADLANQYWYGELPEKNLEELIELLSGILQANAVRRVS